MPMKSKAQRRWMHANKPKMAKKWERHTPKDADLPEKVASLLMIMDPLEKTSSVLDSLSSLQPKLSPTFQNIHKNFVQKNFTADTTLAGNIADSKLGKAGNILTQAISGKSIRQMAPGTSVVASMGKSNPTYKPSMDSIQTHITASHPDSGWGGSRVYNMNKADNMYKDFKKDRLPAMKTNFMSQAKTPADTAYVNTAFPGK